MSVSGYTIAIPSKILITIISFHVRINAVHWYPSAEFMLWNTGHHTRVIRPKATVMPANQIRGPNSLTAMVEGSWNVTLAIVKIKIAIEYLLPPSPRSSIILVTEALEMTPLSSKSRLHRMAAMVHRRRSTLRRSWASRILERMVSTARSPVSGFVEVSDSVSSERVPLRLSVEVKDFIDILIAVWLPRSCATCLTSRCGHMICVVKVYICTAGAEKRGSCIGHQESVPKVWLHRRRSEP